VLLVKGEKDYRAFCFHCHGPNLDGLGTVGQSFSPLPTNLTNEKTAGMSDAELFAFISYGGKKAPALASSMSVESREAVIHYIRSKQKTTL
jgi:mono/diheme cytochrome c family protein